MLTLTCERVLLGLSRQDNSDWGEAIRRITRADAESLKVERVSVWLYSSDRSEIICECLHKMTSDDYEQGIRLKATDYPMYFKAMELHRTVAANDAQVDPRTREFAEGYLKPLGITSMMDVPIRLGGKVVGVICHEHVGPARKWTSSDEEFAAAIASLVSQSHAMFRSREAESEMEKLRRENEDLRSRLEKLEKRPLAKR